MAFNPATGFTVGFGNQNPRQRTIADESTKFPGITKADETKIMNIARSQAHSEYEENLIANDLYKEALKNQNSKNYVSNRQDAKQELSYKSSTTKDKKQSNKLRTTERTAEVADMIRNYAKANGYGNTLEGWEDVDVINGFANDNKQVRQEVEDYINGEESSFSFSKRMGFGAGSERSRFDMITEDKGEWNDDILGHFETESLDDAKGNKVGTWFKNLGKSAYNLASDLTNMVMNPIDTVNNLSKAAVGGAMNLLGSDDYIGNMKDGKVKDRFESANTVADGMGDFLKNRYGGVDQIANSLYQDPVGVISDIASVVTGGAGLVRGAAKATAKTALKAGAKNTVKNASKVANVADDIMKAGIKYDPATQIMNAEGKVLKGAYKGTKATVNTVAHPIESIKGAYRTVAEGLNKVSDWGAEKITKTATAQDKLYKAQEPRMNSLTRNKDLEKRRVNSDRANQLIVENGYKPTDTNSRLLAHEATMKKIWNEVEGRINGGEPVQIDQSRLAEVLYDYIREQKELGSSFNEADLVALEREVKTLEGKNVDLPTLEKKKQLYNSIVNNRGEQKVSDVFANGIKKLTHEIGVIEDEILAEIPGDFQKLKNDFGAMADTYEDVFKADMKNQRKKGLGLTETYSRIEGAGDMLNGALSIFNGGAKDIIKGAGKVLIGKSLAKAKDVDFLVKQGFEELTNGYKTAKSKVGVKYQKYGMADANARNITATEGLNIRNFKNGKTVQQLANQYGIDTKIVDSISTPEGQKAYGMYGDRLITLSKDLKESTVPHELLHGVFDMVDSKRRTSILEGIQKKLNIDNVQAEEWLADNFSEYYRTGKFGTQGLAKGLVEKVKQFFYEVKSYIDGTYKNEKQIRQLFDDIIDGKIEGEYGVYSDPKFQSVWHGSPYDFDRFDSTYMGAGEGHQAHGWGHYVAVNKDTAKLEYADMNKERKYTYNGKTSAQMINSSDKGSIKDQVAKDVLFDVSYQNNRYPTLDDAIKHNEEVYKAKIENLHNGDFSKQYISRHENILNEKLNELKTIKNDIKKEFDSNLYELDIPDPVKKDTPTGSNYLEEDGKITKAQLNKIADALEDYTPGKVIDKGEDLPRLSKDAEKQMADRAKESALYKLRNAELDGAETYRALVDILGSDKAASKFLESLGYDGIHYYGGRDGEAYVIFNDDALEITKHHKY